jgi:hypothetical protein
MESSSQSTFEATCKSLLEEKGTLQWLQDPIALRKVIYITNTVA